MASDLIHLMGRVFNTPLYITQDKLEVIMGVLLPKIMGGELVLAAPTTQAEISSQAGANGDIGVINCFGTLVHRTNGMAAMSGMLSYEALSQQFNAMMNDSMVKAIIFRMDSNGGEGAGLFDLVDQIHAARGHKPIHAFIDERGFSAGYALPSACDTISLTRTAGAGSIGVIAQHVDRSQMNAKNGIVVTPVFAGARKNDFTPNEPLSKEAHQALQHMVDEGYDLFTKTVARNRGLDEKAVRATEAGLFWGEAAIKAGLADSIQTWDQAVAAVSNQIRSRRKGGMQMSKDILVKQLTALMRGDEPDTVLAAMQELGYQKAPSAEEALATKAASEAAIVKAKSEGEAETMAKVGEIVDLCALGGTPQLLGSLLKDNKTVAEARQSIVNAKAVDGNGGVTSTVGSGPGSEINYMIEEAKRRAGQ